MAADSSFVCVTLELVARTKIMRLCEDWSVKTLYDQVAIETTNAGVDTFNLFTDGRILDIASKVKDYQFVHLQRIACIQKTLGGSGLKPLPGFIQLTKEPCSLTSDSEPTESRAKMPCGCVFSVDAVALQCSSTVGSGGCTFDCPMCKQPWQFFLIRHVLSAVMTNDELNEISRKLDGNFVKTPQNDIRQCLKCKTYSMRDFSRGQWYGSRNRVVCNVCTKKNNYRPVEFCWLCGLQWMGGDGDQCGNPECGPAATLRMLSTCMTKEIYGVTGVPDTRACPGCGTLIFHVDACKHMVCQNCHLNFCFVCLLPQDADGEWQCGSYLTQCKVAPRQISLPEID